jgi:manganese/iron transport system permease protein
MGMIDLLFWLPVMLGGTLAGASSGLMGVYIVGMRLPFLGVFISHAALAGAVFGALFGLEGQMLLLPALAAALAAALLLGLLSPDRIRMDSNVLLGVLFSLSMGLSFLGIGLFPVFGRSDNAVRNLLWGSLAFCRWSDVRLMAGTALLVLAFVILFAKEMRAILFCRTQASAAGIHTTLVWTAFLVLTSIVLTVNFQTVGGLMIYSLLTSPAVAAFQLVKGHRPACIAAAAIGAFCGLGGFLIAAFTDLPTGATTVILASLIVAAAVGIRRFRHWPSPSGPHRSARPVELIDSEA